MLASPVLTGSLAAFTSDRDISAWSSSFELTRGLRAALLVSLALLVAFILVAFMHSVADHDVSFHALSILDGHFSSTK